MPEPQAPAVVSEPRSIADVVRLTGPLVADLVSHFPGRTKLNFEFFGEAQPDNFFGGFFLVSEGAPSARERVMVTCANRLERLAPEGWHVNLYRKTPMPYLLISYYTDLNPATGRADEGSPCGDR